MSEKYLGGASDPGEWWVDKPSKADDLGPGVKIYLRVACDEHLPPRIVSVYGLREDVSINRVEEEARRIIADYVAGKGEWNGEPGRIYGALIAPELGQWKSLEDIVARLGRYARDSPFAEGKGVWDMLWAVTGSKQMTDRVIELIGIDTLQKIAEEAPRPKRPGERQMPERGRKPEFLGEEDV